MRGKGTVVTGASDQPLALAVISLPPLPPNSEKWPWSRVSGVWCGHSTEKMELQTEKKCTNSQWGGVRWKRPGPPSKTRGDGAGGASACPVCQALPLRVGFGGRWRLLILHLQARGLQMASVLSLLLGPLQLQRLPVTHGLSASAQCPLWHLDGICRSPF